MATFDLDVHYCCIVSDPNDTELCSLDNQNLNVVFLHVTRALKLATSVGNLNVPGAIQFKILKDDDTIIWKVPIEKFRTFDYNTFKKKKNFKLCGEKIGTLLSKHKIVYVRNLPFPSYNEILKHVVVSSKLL